MRQARVVTLDRADLRALLLATTREAGWALSAIARLAEVDAPGVVETLFDACAAKGARVRAAALRVLAKHDHSLRDEAMRRALADDSPLVRGVALEHGPVDEMAFLDVVAFDSSHKNRGIALRRLLGAEHRAAVTVAASDPHWRVRAVLVPLLVPDDVQRLQQNDPITAGVRAWLVGEPPPAMPEAPLAPWDDDDPAVARRTLDEGAPLSTADAIGALSHESPSVRARGRDVLRNHGDAEELAAALALDSRLIGAAEAFRLLTTRVDRDRLDAAAEVLRSRDEAPAPRLAWAVSRAEDPARWRGHPSPRVRAAAVRAGDADEALRDPDTRVRLAALNHAVTGIDEAFTTGDATFRRAAMARHESLTERGLGDEDAETRAIAVGRRGDGAGRRDPDHRVRAAAVDRSWAAEALDDTCPRVWLAAAEALRTHVERALGIAPAKPSERAPAPMLAVTPPDASSLVPLGNTGLQVSRLGISGHYGLSVEGFAEGVARGVSFFFWEPTYRDQTAFMHRVPSPVRERLVVAAGTFEASPQTMRADLDRALKQMRLDVLDLFIVFWVRSKERLRDDVRDYLDEEVARGRIRAWGMSTHQRPLARWALGEGMDPVMVRFNAAHRGPESEVLPHVKTQGILGFSNLLYGRLLQPGPDGWAPQPWQCYRYVLDLPKLTSTWTAPANLPQLEHNLLALERELSAEDRERLLAHGARVHGIETRFRHCVRSR